MYFFISGVCNINYYTSTKMWFQAKFRHQGIVYVLQCESSFTKGSRLEIDWKVMLSLVAALIYYRYRLLS